MRIMNQDTKEFVNRIVDAYLNPVSGINVRGNPPRANLRYLAEIFNLSVARIRKILISEGVFENKTSTIIRDLINQGKNLEEIMKITGLSKSSVNNYIGYSKGFYNNDYSDKTVLNKRVIKHRENKEMEDCVGSAFSSSSKRVIFYSKSDLSIGFYIDSVKEYLLNSHEIESLSEAIHAYNCFLFINNGIFGKNWSKEESDLIIKNSNIIKENVYKFLASNPSIVLDELLELDHSYTRSVLRMASTVGIYKKWNRDQFQMLLNDSLVMEIMEIEKLVKFFDKEITQFLLTHIETTSEMLFENNYKHVLANLDSRYYFPPSFGVKEKTTVLVNYCQSEISSIEGLICIINMKDVYNRLDIDTKELIQRKIDEQTIERMNNSPSIEMPFMDFGVRFVPDSFNENNNSSDNTKYLDYSLTELDKRLDYEGIHFCLTKIFGFFDFQNGFVELSRKRRGFSLSDDLLGPKFKDGYNLDSSQQILMILTNGTLSLYYNYLRSHGISLEKHLGIDFSQHLKDKYQIDLFGFELPIFEASFKIKCTAIAPAIETLINRLYLIEQGKTIDRFSLSSVSGIQLSAINSALPDKYLYITDNKKKSILVDNLSYLLFSFQHLFLMKNVRFEYENMKNNYDLLLIKNITRSEIMDCDQHKVDYLLNNKCIVEHNGCLRPTKRAFALKELWKNGCITTYYSPCGLKLLASLVNDGWLIGASCLLAKPEQELISFLYDNKLFSDSWGLRNCYAHGSDLHFNEDKHMQNYMWFLYIIIILESKLIEELEMLRKITGVINVSVLSSDKDK